jgi:hypothetical protein
VHPLFVLADLILPVAVTAFASYRLYLVLPEPLVDPAPRRPPARPRMLDRSAGVLEEAAKRMPPSPESARLLRAAQALRTADSIRVLKDDIGRDFDDPTIQKALRDAGIRLD